jgi:hypothetical protein
MSTQVFDTREQKIQELMAGGRDRFAAENIADGRPEWSQRVDTSLDDMPNTKKAIEQARRDKRTPGSYFKVTLGDLESQLGNINMQIDHWTDAKEAAAADVLMLEDIASAATEILADAESSRGDRSLAAEKLDRVNPRLEIARNKLSQATGLLKVWRQRLKEFPVAQLKKLQCAQARAERLRF